MIPIKRILFITGTRADYGKLKPLILRVANDGSLESHIFVTGMHTLRKFGESRTEIIKDGFKNTHLYMNQIHGEPIDLVLSNTISGMSRYVSEALPDMIVVHGDRVEALAGAVVGSFNNILVAHIEGGEVSGTIDGLIRHAITKLSHVHFVSNEKAKKRLLQLGEDPAAVFVIGSPDIDIMLSSDLPEMDQVRERYEIGFPEYGIVLFHPVTTELDAMEEHAESLVDALILSGEKYVVIYPNNDPGNDKIFRAYSRLTGERFKLFPTIRFEYFLTLLKNSKFLIGNSSAGIRESPIYGIYSINIGTRQQGRCSQEGIINTGYAEAEILKAIQLVKSRPTLEPSFDFGNGKSGDLFIEILKEGCAWKICKQKKFWDM